MVNKQNLNLSIDIKTFREAKRLVPPRQISKLFNEFLKEYTKRKKQERLIASYKKTARSKAVRKEDEIWEDATADGIDK